MRKLVSWKKLFLLALCVCMIFSLVACANNTNENNGEGSEIVTPSYSADFGQISEKPGDSYKKILEAIFAEKDKSKYLNMGFAGDLELDLGTTELVDVNVDAHMSLDLKNSSDSKFSLVLSDGKTVGHPLWGAYFDGINFIVDNRGMGGEFTYVDTDIVYLLNKILEIANMDGVKDKLDKVSDFKSMMPIVADALVKSGAMTVYEKYVEETNTTEITSTLSIKKAVTFAIDVLSGNTNIIGSSIIDSLKATLQAKGVDINQIVEKLNKVASAIPALSTLNLTVGVKGAGSDYELVSGSLKVSTSKITFKSTMQSLTFADQSENIKQPVGAEGLSPENSRHDKIGGFAFDVSLGLDISQGQISVADIDSAIGGLLKSFAPDLDFSGNLIKVTEQARFDIRISAAINIDIKDNNKTNILLQIYSDKNTPDGEKPKCDEGESLIQIYYLGSEQAFFIDFTGLGHSELLPNKLKIQKDINGNYINLTQLCSDAVVDLIQKDGKLDFTSLIDSIKGMIAGDDATATAELKDTAQINQKMLQTPLRFVTTEQRGASIDTMAIVKTILQELEFDKNPAGVLNGISLQVTNKMFKDIFNAVGMDISIFKGAYVGLHVTQDGLNVKVSADLNANTYKDGEKPQNFPTVKLNVEINADMLHKIEEADLPDPSKTKGDWQLVELKKVEKNGKIDLMGTILSALEGKKVHVGATLGLKLAVSTSGNDVISVGTALNQSIGGALGAALADLQLKTGQLVMDYELSLIANIDLPSVLSAVTSLQNPNLTTNQKLDLIKVIIPEQEISIILREASSSYTSTSRDLIALLLSGGNLYIDATELGIDKLVIGIDDVLEIVAQVVTNKEMQPKAPEGTLVGVQNNGTTNTDVSFSWSGNHTATLDGKPYVNGATISEEGKHTLVLESEVGLTTTYTFTIDRTYAPKEETPKATVPKDPLVIVLAVVSNIDIINVAEKELAISFNSAFLNNILPLLASDPASMKNFDLTLQELTLSINSNSKEKGGITPEEYATFLNSIMIGAHVGIDLSGILASVDVKAGGLNIGIVDTSTDEQYKVYSYYFKNRNKNEFYNPLDGGLVGIGLQGSLKLTGDGAFSLAGKDFQGEIGAMLKNLALVLGMENVNKELILKLDAGLDITNLEGNNQTEIALEILSKTNNGTAELVAGVYIYKGAIYVNVPALANPFMLEFDVVSFLFDQILNPEIATANSTAGAVDTNTTETAREFDLASSIIDITSSTARVTLSKNLIKGLVFALTGDAMEKNIIDQAQGLDPKTGKEMISLFQALPFDIAVVGDFKYGDNKADSKLLTNLNVGLNILIGKSGSFNNIKTDEQLQQANKDVIGLAVNLGGIYIKGFRPGEQSNANKVITTSFDNLEKENKHFDYLGNIANLDSLDINEILKDTVVALNLDLRLAITSNGVVVEGTGISNDIAIELQKMLNTLPDLLIRIGAMNGGLNTALDLNIHLAAQIKVGKLLAGNVNEAVTASIGIYKEDTGFVDVEGNKTTFSQVCYDANGNFDYGSVEPFKLIAILVKPVRDYNGNYTLSIFVDADGLSKNEGNRVIAGRLRMDNISLNELFNTVESGEAVSSSDAIATANDFNTTMANLNNVVGIINGALDKLTITNDGVHIELGYNIIGILLNILTNNDGSAKGAKVPLTEGAISLFTKDVYKDAQGNVVDSTTKGAKLVYKKGLNANIGIKKADDTPTTLALGIGVSGLHLAFAEQGANFFYDATNYSETEFIAIKDIPAINLNLNLSVDVDLNHGVHKLDLVNKYGQLLGDYMWAVTNKFPQINVDDGSQGTIGNTRDLHLEVIIEGTVGIKNADDTYLHLLVNAYTKGKTDGKYTTPAMRFIDLHLYNDNIYIDSDLLNINKIMIPKLGISQMLVDLISPILSNIGGGASEALSTATDGGRGDGNLDFIIGDRTLEIAVGKAFVTSLLQELVLTNDKELAKALVDNLFGKIDVKLDLGNMSASLYLALINNELKEVNPENTNLKDNLLGVGIALNALQIDTFSDYKKPASELKNYNEAETNAFLELGATVMIDRSPVTNKDIKYEVNDKGEVKPGNLLGALSGLVKNLDMLDDSLRTTINKIIQSLWIQIVNQEGGDNGMDIALDVLVQINLDWNDWRNLDLHGSSFRLLLQSKHKDISQSTGFSTPKTVADIFFIGKENTVYMDIPFMGVNKKDGTSLTKIKLEGINLITVLADMIAPAQAESDAITTATESETKQLIAQVLDIVNVVLGEVSFNQDGFKLGIAPKALIAVASVLGLIPSFANQKDLILAIDNVAHCFELHEDTGIYLDYASLGEDAKQSEPKIGLKLGLKGIGLIGIELNQYSLSVVNNFTKYEGSTDFVKNPAVDYEGLKALRGKSTKYNFNNYTSLLELQNIQVTATGELSASVFKNMEPGTQGGGLNLDGLVQTLLGSILVVPELKELGLGVRIGSDIDSTKTLKFTASANIDLSAFLKYFELAVTIYKEDGVNTLVGVYYKDNTLFIDAPDYINVIDAKTGNPSHVMRVENVDSLFGGGASALAGETGNQSGTTENKGSTTTPVTKENLNKNLAALQILFGESSVGVNITSGVLALALVLLDGKGIEQNTLIDMFNSLYNQLDVGITLGSNKVDGNLSLQDLYAQVNLRVGPFGLGLKVSDIAVAVGKDINTDEGTLIKDKKGVAYNDTNTTHYSDAIFRVNALGRIGISAQKTVIKLNELLKDFGVNKSLDFGVELADPTDPNARPIDLHLGLTIDAELCLGDFNNCNIKVALLAYHGKQELTGAVNKEDVGREVLAVYINGGEVYLDINNDIISIGTIKLDKVSLDKIIAAIKKPVEGDNSSSGEAISTANTQNQEAVAVANIIALSFAGEFAKDGSTLGLGRINAEIGAGVLNAILGMLHFDNLAGKNPAYPQGANATVAAVIEFNIKKTDATGNEYLEPTFGIGLNITTPEVVDGKDTSILLNGAGIYLFVGGINFVKVANEQDKVANPNSIWKDEKNSPRPLFSNFHDENTEVTLVADLYQKFAHIDLSVDLAMMTSKVETETVTPNEDGSLVLTSLLTEFFRGMVPWMPNFEALLEVLGATSNEFFTSHTLRLQANVNIGMLINKKTCNHCGKDFVGNETEYVKNHRCPNCGYSEEYITDKPFYLKNIDLALEVIRNTKANTEAKDSALDVATTSEVLLGLYIVDSEIALYGEGFGLNNFVIDKASVESIAKTVTSLINGNATSTNDSALSTAEANTSTTSEEDATLDIFGLLNSLVRTIYVSMYVVRVGIGENILSFIPTLTKMLGIQGFPEFGYPTINENNYLQIGLIKKAEKDEGGNIIPGKDSKIDLSIGVNLDMFGINTAFAINKIDLAVGNKVPIVLPESLLKKDELGKPIQGELNKDITTQNLEALNQDSSVINVNVEAELKLNLNQADTKATALLGELLGNLTAGYKVDKTVTKDYVLRIKGQLDIKDYSAKLGVEILEVRPGDIEGETNLLTILGIYYDSTVDTAYVNSSILSNFKVEGIKLDKILGMITSEDEAFATALDLVASTRPVVNDDVVLKENQNKPAVKVTLALKQYLAVAISGELIKQLVDGIEIDNRIPALPDFEIGIKVGKDNENAPFAITLQAGLGDNNGKGFLVDLIARVNLGPIYNEVQGNKHAYSHGTYVNLITPDDASKDYQIITNDMKAYPTLLTITVDDAGKIVPEFDKNATVAVNLSLFVQLGMNQGFNDFGYIFKEILSGYNTEISAIANALATKEFNLRVDLSAQINVYNLVMPLLTGGNISLDGSVVSISATDIAKNKLLFELMVAGGKGQVVNGEQCDAIYINVIKGEKDENVTQPSTDEKDFRLKVDTISIMGLVNSLTSGNGSAISTATVSANDSLTQFVNGILKGIHICELQYVTGTPDIKDAEAETILVNTADIVNGKVVYGGKTYTISSYGDSYGRVNINFTPQIFDNLIKLVTVLMINNQDTTVDTILGVISSLKLPQITDGGIYLELKKNDVGLGAGLDITIDGQTKVLLGLEVKGVEVTNVAPVIKEDGYTSLNDGAKINIDFKGFIEVSNHNTPDPMSIGGLITSILKLANVNIGNDIDFNVDTRNTEEYGIILKGYVDTNDFKRDEKGNKLDGNPATSQVLLQVNKAGTYSDNRTATPRTLISVYVDFASSAIYVDLQGLNLPKIKVTNLDLAKMLGSAISPFVGGNTVKAEGTSQVASDYAVKGNVYPSKLNALLYLQLDEKGGLLRFNADLINGLLRLILSVVKEAKPNDPVINGLQGLELPTFGQVEIEQKDLTPEEIAAGNSPFEIVIYRTDNIDDNYLSIGYYDASMSVGKTGNKVYSTELTPKDYANIFDIENGLKLTQVGIDAALNLVVDFTNKATGEGEQFTHYISRVLSLLLDGDEKEEHIKKYEVKIIGDDINAKKLHYQVRVKGTLDLTDMFGKSELSLEIWKLDLIEGLYTKEQVNTEVNGITVTEDMVGTINYAKNTHTMLIGAYLKQEEVSTGVTMPTLYADLNNIGLPRIKLVNIDSMLGGALSSSDDAISTSDAEAVSRVIYNSVKVVDNRVTLELNRGFIYGILGAVAKDVFKDGYIVAGNIRIPLPRIRGVAVDIDLTEGLKSLDIKAYLEENSNNHLSIGLQLNKIELAGEGDTPIKPFEWDNVGNKYNSAEKGKAYFDTFGAVHIGTSFKADMMNSIINAVNPNIVIDYQKRGNSRYTGDGDTTAYNAVKGHNQNSWAGVGQSWDKIYIGRSGGNAQQNLQVDIDVISGASNRGIQKVKVYVSPNGVIHAYISEALADLKALKPLVGSITNNIEVPLGNGKSGIGGLVFPGRDNFAGRGASAISTAEKPYDPFEGVIDTNKIGELIDKISIRIYTTRTNAPKSDEYGRPNGTDAKQLAHTTIQVKLNPTKVNDLFDAVNWLITSVFDGNIKNADGTLKPNYSNGNKINLSGGAVVDKQYVHDHPEIIGHLLVNPMLGNLAGDALASAINLLGQIRTDLMNLLATLLPLPQLNVNPNPTDNDFKMPVTDDTDVDVNGNRNKETCRSELNINLNFDPAVIAKKGALESIRAEFGNYYGFVNADLGKMPSNDERFWKGYNVRNIDTAKKAVNNNLGYMLLNIQASDDSQLIGFKSVTKVNKLEQGGENALKKVATQYYDTAQGKLVENTATPEKIVITDPLKSISQLKSFVIKKYDLPLTAQVSYTQNKQQSTGGGITDVPHTAFPVTIVWDDSRIKLTHNGSKPDGNDNYLYGWVQNQLIAKIPVYVDNKYGLDKVIDFTMPNEVEKDHIIINKVIPTNPMVNEDGTTNLQIELDTYFTKNLPTSVTIKHNTGVKTYTTTAVKRIVYKPTAEEIAKDPSLDGKIYNDKIDENITQVYDIEVDRIVKVDKVGWQGDWYASKDKMTADDEVDGRLEWDTSKLSWNTNDPYTINKNVGNGTVSMKLITGKFDDFVLNDIKVIANNPLTKEHIIKAINKLFGKEDTKALNIDLIQNPDFVEILKSISSKTTQGDVTITTGNGLSNVEIDRRNSIDLISKDEITLNFANLNMWLRNNNNRYSGSRIEIPITVERSLQGGEKTALSFTLTVNVEKVEIADAKVTVEETNKYSGKSYMRDVTTELNPYKEFGPQIQEIFKEKTRIEPGKNTEGQNGSVPYLTVYLRKANGISEPINIKIDGIGSNGTGTVTNIAENTSFDLRGTARVKFDIASIYSSYSNDGNETSMTAYVGSFEHGYLKCTVPVRTERKVIAYNKFNVGYNNGKLDGNINLMDSSSLSNNGKPLSITIKDVGDLDILWFDRDELVRQSNLNKTEFDIDAVIGYKQRGVVDNVEYASAETSINNFLNKRVKLHIGSAPRIYELKLTTFAGVNLTEMDKNGNYIIPLGITTEQMLANQEIGYEYFTTDGKSVKGIMKADKLYIGTNKITVKLGIYEKSLVVKDTYTKVVSITEVGRLKKNTEATGNKFVEGVNNSRVFDIVDGVYEVKYGFAENFPYYKTVEGNNAMLDESELKYNVELKVPVVGIDGNFVMENSVVKMQNVTVENVILHQNRDNASLYEGEFQYGIFTFKVRVTK